MSKPIDILILSNGPGEITTWVRPVVKALRQKLGHNPAKVRLSVILSPCPNASGKEAAIALSYPEVDRVQGAEHFWQFLIWGKTLENWNWRDHGIVVFLGGDQIFPVIIAQKLGYRTVVYAECAARWHGWINRFAVMSPQVALRVKPKYAHKFTVVGDLMQQTQNLESLLTNNSQIIGLLPGSKTAKLSQGVPLCLAVAEYIYAKKPDTKFFIPVAPTLDLPTLGSFANPKYNPFVKVFGSSPAVLVESPQPMLKTEKGLSVGLWTKNPAHELLSQCSICLTTVGANTAELGALAIPMIVVIPTQQLDAMRSWDGLPGLLANLPGLGSTFAKVINSLVLRRRGLLAWPNIWAKQEIVPELVGKLQPEAVGEIFLDFLAHPEKLAAMRSQLRSVRGETGAADKIAQIIIEEIAT